MSHLNLVIWPNSYQSSVAHLLERPTGIRTSWARLLLGENSKKFFPSNLCHCPNFQISFYILANSSRILFVKRDSCKKEASSITNQSPNALTRESRSTYGADSFMLRMLLLCYCVYSIWPTANVHRSESNECTSMYN